MVTVSVVPRLRNAVLKEPPNLEHTQVTVDPGDEEIWFPILGKVEENEKILWKSGYCLLKLYRIIM